MKDKIIKQLIKYIESAENWDVYEIAEYAFGYDDPFVEMFREEIEKSKNEVV